MVLDVAKDNRK